MSDAYQNEISLQSSLLKSCVEYSKDLNWKIWNKWARIVNLKTLFLIIMKDKSKVTLPTETTLCTFPFTMNGNVIFITMRLIHLYDIHSYHSLSAKGNLMFSICFTSVMISVKIRKQFDLLSYWVILAIRHVVTN